MLLTKALATAPGSNRSHPTSASVIHHCAQPTMIGDDVREAACRGEAREKVYTSVVVDLSMTEARKHFGALVRRAATVRERVTITDHGQPAAVLVNAQELAELEEALAVAHYRARQSGGEPARLTHAEVRDRLGLHRS
jgi:prevent-host-death family protein